VAEEFRVVGVGERRKRRRQPACLCSQRQPFDMRIARLPCTARARSVPPDFFSEAIGSWRFWRSAF
jgi:hypothetical protein